MFKKFENKRKNIGKTTKEITGLRRGISEVVKQREKYLFLCEIKVFLLCRLMVDFIFLFEYYIVSYRTIHFLERMWAGVCGEKSSGICDCGHDVGRLINTISHQLKRRMSIPEEEDSLRTNMQRLVLHYILFESLKRDIYQKDVEKEFQIRRSTATGTLQILEKNGFITRDPVKEDARLKKLTPTDKAKGVRQHILDNIRYVEGLLAGEIPEEKLTVCREVLQQMSENLSCDEKRREEITDHE